MLRVVVVDIKDSSACVPLPSEEVQTVGQASGNFIIWPARLAKPVLDVSKNTNIFTPPQPQLSPLQQLGAAVVTMENKTIEIDMPPELTCKTATTTLYKANTLSIKNILEASLEAHSRLWGVPSISRKKMQIITPNCRRQLGNYECGYYVMKHMHTNITESWNKIFNDSSPMEAADIEDIRRN
ncbi:hypothetical protein LR48_Vigan08g046600 [Vigna angularis]|uniref:Ubiquitin-like protease family profile domain-containing protein n=1 Tax=Phaseolus angularis TaxID=3914 RepID=A0A0L9V4K4_PHAAN|nr:hypothetical protein LR48_Vigan08g046600 [Vigna angularis]